MEKKARLEEARLKGELHDCAICLQAEVLQEELLPCPAGHQFCRECVRRHGEEQVGQGRGAIPCMDMTCTQPYTLFTLEKVLPTRLHSLVVERVQAEEVRQAAVEDLVSCPFCPYSVSIDPEEGSHVFHCENPDCMKDSCR